MKGKKCPFRLHWHKWNISCHVSRRCGLTLSVKQEARWKEWVRNKLKWISVSYALKWVTFLVLVWQAKSYIETPFWSLRLAQVCRGWVRMWDVPSLCPNNLIFCILRCYWKLHTWVVYIYFYFFNNLVHYYSYLNIGLFGMVT